VCDELKSVLQEPPPLSLLKTKPGKCIFLKNRRRRFNALPIRPKKKRIRTRWPNDNKHGAPGVERGNIVSNVVVVVVVVT
jgi:hypothetical protein